MTANEDREPGYECGRCGSTARERHAWIEGDCILQHRNHSKATVGFVCQWCVDRHISRLTEIVELYGTLATVLLPGSVPDDTADHKRPKKAPEAPPPLRLAAWAMLNDTARLRTKIRNPETGEWEAAYLGANLPDVPGVLSEWAQNVHDAHGWTSTAPVTVTGACATLRAQSEFIAVQSWVDEYDAELKWVWTHLRQAHGMGSTGRQPVGRCPSLDGAGKECEGPLWPDESGGMAVECGRCERRYGEGFLRHLGGMLDAS